jgi:hypothetical protein
VKSEEDVFFLSSSLFFTTTTLSAFGKSGAYLIDYLTFARARVCALLYYLPTLFVIIH